MRMISALSAMALLVGLPALAEAPESRDAFVTLGLTSTQGDARDMTQKGLGGFSVELGYRFLPEGYGVELRPYAGFVKLPGNDPKVGERTFQLAAPKVGLDLVYHPSSTLPLVVTVGPSLHFWQVEELGLPGDTRAGDQGLKVGFRLGLGYELKDWTVGLSYTQTEWRSVGGDAEYVRGFNPSKPAYLTFTGTLRF